MGNDLPDYQTETKVIAMAASSITSGLDAAKTGSPAVGDIYLATDTDKLYVCIVAGAWTGFDASMLVQGILTLYANLAGNSKRITNIADPAADQDAATKKYVDDAILAPFSILQFGGLVSTTTSAKYAFSYGNGTVEAPATETFDTRLLCPIAGTIKLLYVALTAALTTQTLTVTVRLNGVDQALTCVVAAGASTASDLTHSFAVVAGDRVSVSMKKNDNIGSNAVLISMVCTQP